MNDIVILKAGRVMIYCKKDIYNAYMSCLQDLSDRPDTVVSSYNNDIYKQYISDDKCQI